MNTEILKMALMGQSDPAGMMQALLDTNDLSESKKQVLQALMANGTVQNETVDETLSVDDDTGVDDNTRDGLMDKVGDLLEAAECRIEELEELNASFAEAVGACTTCFGADFHCDDCNGDGRPGFRAPDRQAFTFYVTPVLSRMKLKRTASKPETASSDQGSQVPMLKGVPQNES